MNVRRSSSRGNGGSGGQGGRKTRRKEGEDELEKDAKEETHFCL